MPRRAAGRKKGYGKGVKTAPDFPPASNLVGGRSGFLKERHELLLGNTLPGRVAEQQHGGFLIVGLPGAQKAMRRRQGGHVILVERSAPLWLALG